MASGNNDWKNRLGMVYSTNPDFKFDTADNEPDSVLLPPNRQKLRLRIEKNGRGGKTVTVVSGFSGPDSSLQELARSLKTYCGCGGSAKDSEIIIQGDMRQKIAERLKSLGYTDVK